MTLVFIHGSGGNADVWRLQTSHFEGSLAVTLPGHPEGDPLETIEDAAAWTWQQIQDNDITDPVVVGHSLGGGIALQIALDHPGELAGLILVGSGARLRVHPAILAELEACVNGKDGLAALFEDSFKLVDPDFAADMERDRDEMGPGAFLADLKACDRFDVIERLGEIEVASLAIVGSDDEMTPPKYSGFLAERMPSCEVVTIEGATHFVFAEFGDQVNSAIESYLT